MLLLCVCILGKGRRDTVAQQQVYIVFLVLFDHSHFCLINTRSMILITDDGICLTFVVWFSVRMCVCVYGELWTQLLYCMTILISNTTVTSVLCQWAIL